MYENEIKPQTAVLVAVDTGEYDIDVSLDELEELAATAGAQVIGRMVQKRTDMDVATCIGSGRLAELALFCENTQADMVIFDHELTPAQLRNIEDACDTSVLDRTMLILDIFAQRARSGEGKLQVELAQQRYLLPRLAGLGNILSRQGGGIGTRGPGETKLETDRRHIRARIHALEERLESLTRHRENLRARRKKDGVTTVAIVGYTNVGKSTLLNALTDAGVLAEDKLFATLDPTTRSFTLPGDQQILLTDTVGFIRKLPHHLIEAFKSTLEEAKYSDIILHVVDCSNPQMDMQMHVVRETLKDLEIVDKTVVTVFNKTDRLRALVESGEAGPLAQLPRDFSADYQVRISAKTGEGLDELCGILEQIIRSRRVHLEKVYPYSQAGRIQTIRKYGQLLKEEYTEDGIAVEAYVPAELFGKLYAD